MATTDSTPSGTDVTLSRGPTIRQGVAAVALTTTLDAVTTLVGLTFVPGVVEGNPVVRAVFRQTGVLVGVVLVSAVVLVGITLLTELAVVLTYWYPNPEPSRTTVRYLGYGIPSAVSVVAGVNNLTLLLSGVSLL
ncbi:DUF5658 family protein [Haloarchaeobius sp. HRN-SO-5]|uniref:DUF5658 family protein n=1 Tax=Haloarchaeobius sp. HRN-SO-5 TaxID=3446118 RepID=UPI003EB95982